MFPGVIFQSQAGITTSCQFTLALAVVLHVYLNRKSDGGRLGETLAPLWRRESEPEGVKEIERKLTRRTLSDWLGASKACPAGDFHFTLESGSFSPIKHAHLAGGSKRK